jgi:YkoY family integral membrane protein
MIWDLLADTGFSSIFTMQSLYVVLSLILIEGLLSVDNALAIAAMASHLDEKRRKWAMTIGYAGAYGFRLVALFMANIIIDNHWLMILGAAYLIWLMCNHFADEEEEEAIAAGHAPTQPKSQSFAKTITMIALLDLSLSFDNVVAAIAFARDNIWMVYLGVTIGIITLRMVAGYCITLLKKQPWLEHTAFILVGFVGALLCVELIWDQLVKKPVTFAGIPIITEMFVIVDDLPHDDSATDQGSAVTPDKSTDKAHYHIAKVVKFGGIMLIVFGHLAYERLPGMKPIFRPPLKVIRYFLALFARCINAVFRIVTAPIWVLFRRSDKQG